MCIDRGTIGHYRGTGVLQIALSFVMLSPIRPEMLSVIGVCALPESFMLDRSGAALTMGVFAASERIALACTTPCPNRSTRALACSTEELIPSAARFTELRALLLALSS